MGHTCLFKILWQVFSNCQLNYNCCLLMTRINTVAVIKNSEQSFKIFDAHSRDLHGMPHSFGKCTLLTIEGIENLVSYLKISCLQIGVVPFEIKGVFVRDNELDLQNVHESPKIEHLPFRNKRNQTQHMKRKQKSLTEMPEEKEKWLFARHATHAGFPTVGLSSKWITAWSCALTGQHFTVWTFSAGCATLKLGSHYWLSMRSHFT